MNRLKQRLLAGETVTAAWSEMGSPDNAEAIAANGWPVIVIDGEHGVGDLETWVAIARAVESVGGEVALRVPEATEALLKRVLDRGFRSIMVPQVNTAEHAAAIASWCRYPPLGGRGYAAPIVRASRYGAVADYARRAHEELLLMVQVEHHEAVANLASIAAAPGVDMLFVGPNDLSASIDRLEAMESSETQGMLKRVEAEASDLGAMLGTVTGGGRSIADLARLGYRLIVAQNDVSLLVNATRAAAAERDAMLAEVFGAVAPAPVAAARTY